MFLSPGSPGRVALVAWELGAGRGHLEHLAPVLDTLLERGWAVVAALRDFRLAKQALGWPDGARAGKRLTLIPAPILTHRTAPMREQPSSLSQILAHIGFDDHSLLRPVVRDWERIIDHVRPKVILADFAPSAVAAAGGRVPVIMTGNGWTIPPDGSPIPAFDYVSADKGASSELEERICEAFSVATSTGSRCEGLAHLLRGDRRFIYTSPLLDPYREVRQDRRFCPPNILPLSELPHARRNRVVLYLPKAHPATKLFLAGASLSGQQVVAYLGGDGAITPSNVQISSSPLNLRALLPTARCLLHHGGLGMANWGLAQGCGQVVAPVDAEKRCIASALKRFRLGDDVSGPDDPRSVSEKIASQSDARPPIEAKVFFKRHGGHTTSAVVECCETL